MITTTNRRPRGLVALAGAGIVALALTACTADPAENGTGGEATGGTITAAEVNELTSLNDAESSSNLDINGKVAYLTSSQFVYLDEALEFVPNETFGTVELVSEDPLVVTYTINEGQVWSDGTQISADDLLLNWAVQSGYYNDATVDPESGEVTGGNSYFNYAGDTSGLGLSEYPEISDDNLSMTLTYTEPYADWQLVGTGLIGRPMHVIAEEAGVTIEEVREAFESTPRGNPDAPAEENATIRAVADFWNTGYIMSEFPSNENLLVSSGAFILSAWEPTQSITLERNPEYAGGLEPSYDSIVIRFIGDANAQVTALQNGEVDIIKPQASADTISSLEAIADATVLQGDEFNYDHIDLSFSGVFADQNVREAFLKTIPRQQILDAIVTPVNPEAAVLDSQIFVPTVGEAYDTSVANNGSDAYAEVDIEGARELLAGATPTVNILYNSENPNRVDAFEAIAASASEAGFIVEAQGTPEWGSLLGSGTYDASIFGWVSSGVGVAGVPQIFSTNGGGNYSGYSNPEVDALAQELQTTIDPDAQIEIQQEIDALLFADAYGLPLFQGPGVTAHSSAVEGITQYPGQTGVFWNFWEWNVVG
ncbi:ABC transporter family substrate-binding protein [Microcella daejeonensis]|uniref:ABC transporter family substrate-binding protein n=1 Tax=Microcella daejeonensis TaxID=2994971 RepID=UPI002D1E3B76|nr:ABC transporter family substrate-binding protein [Microcella daejeonensis]